MLVGADDQRDRMRTALTGQLDRVVLEQVAIDNWDKSQRARVSYGDFVEHFA